MILNFKATDTSRLNKCIIDYGFSKYRNRDYIYFNRYSKEYIFIDSCGNVITNATTKGTTGILKIMINDKFIGVE